VTQLLLRGTVLDLVSTHQIFINVNESFSVHFLQKDQKCTSYAKNASTSSLAVLKADVNKTFFGYRLKLVSQTHWLWQRIPNMFLRMRLQNLD